MSQENRETILVVDDSRTARSIAVRVLSDLGFSVHAAVDGFEALQLVSAHPEISIVLTDLVMPKMSGVSLIQLIRQNFKGRDIGIIALSVDSSEEMVDRVRSLGILGILSKPVNAAQVSTLIQEFRG